MIGERIEENVEITGRLGKGAFGTVFRARQISLNRDVAVKFLEIGKADEQALRRFHDEARHLAGLNHPNVVHVHSLGEYNGKPYIIMELLEGQTLKRIMREERPAIQSCIRIMLDVARGLQELHANDIIHRDLSPNNVMVSRTGTKVFDLGLAKDLAAASTGSGQYIIGTVGYMAPEQIEAGKVTAASDVFSFGAVLYELLTGRNPHEAEHHMSILYNIVHRTPKPITSLIQDCPEALSELIHGCLAKNPADRPARMESVVQQLSQCLASGASSKDFGTSPDLEDTVQLPSRRSNPNPYLNRMMIRRRKEFYGRKQEVRRIFARLNASPPGCISIVGDRKIGKSSLLNFVYSQENRRTLLAEPDTTVMVFMDLQQDDMTMTGFIKNLIQMAALELHGRLDLEDFDFTLDGVRKMVQSIDAAGMKLVILLDEFERITANPDFPLEFFSFLRFLANHYSVAYLTSSARDLQSLCHDQVISDSPFFNIFSTMQLTVFTREEAEELIREPSEQMGYPLVGSTEKILELSGLFPFFIQIACCHSVEYLEEQGGPGEIDFEEVRRRFLEESTFHYRHMWDRFDSTERSVLRKVARGSKVQDAFTHVLEDLSARHFVALQGDKPRLFSTTFEEFAQKTPKESTGLDGLFSNWKQKLFGQRSG